MNYRVVKNSKSNVIQHHLSNNITTQKISKPLFNFSTHLIRICKYALTLILGPTKYVYDEVSDTCKPCNDNCYFKDIYNLKLKASQRTFL